mmetsp:Transcript_28647/g.46568  ORF Transcript_28647/g.46568 Transcript_28647/m.46568 type:complete len:149 (-) Transcript_28647:100-546(-)
MQLASMWRRRNACTPTMNLLKAMSTRWSTIGSSEVAPSDTLADRLNLSSITSEADLLDSSKSTDEGLDLDSASDGNSTSIGLEEALAVTLSDTSGDAEDIAERLTEVLIDGHNGKLKTDLALKVTDRSGESKIDSKLAASSKQTAGAR